MSTIKREGRHILKYAQLSVLERKRQKQEDAKSGIDYLKKIQDKRTAQAKSGLDYLKKKRQQKKLDEAKKRADTGKKVKSFLTAAFQERARLAQGSRSEFASSIPQENTTMATLSTEVRSGFQSPGPSPPRTPPRTPRRSGPTLVRTETPVWKKTIADPPKALPETAEPRKRAGKKKPNVTTRGRAKRMAKAHAARAKPIKPSKLAPVPRIDISGDTDTEADVTDEKAQDSARSRHTPASESETETESDEWDPTTVYAPQGVRARLAAHRTRTIARPITNMAGFRALRAKQRKDRQNFKKQRSTGRHQTIRTHTPFVPKLQISQKGPGQYAVRATGITPAVRNQVRTLLGRVTGKLFINGKFTATKRAFAVVMNLLAKKQVIHIQIK